MQNALLCLQSEKTKNHRQVVIYPIVQDKRRVNTLFPVSVSVIFRFLLSAYHRLFTARLCLKQLFIKDTAAFLLSLSSVIVYHASLSLVFTVSLPDSRRPLVMLFSSVLVSGVSCFGRLSPAEVLTKLLVGGMRLHCQASLGSRLLRILGNRFAILWSRLQLTPHLKT